MEKAGSPSGACHLLLFLLLSALLVAAAAHLLETVCHSVGLVHARPAAQEDFSVDAPLSPIMLGYRILVATASLFLAYHCLSLRDWARRRLVQVLVADLIFALVWTGWRYLPSDSLPASPERWIVQVLAIALECGLVWLLTHPEAVRHFVPEPPKGSIVPT